MTDYSQKPRLEAIIIIALLLLVCIPSLFTRDLWNPDEPRYTQVGLEMLHSGNFMVPHLNGDIYSDKPPLFFWLVAAFAKLGAGILAGRLVTLAAVTATTAIVYCTARQLLRKDAALLSVGIFLSTGLSMHFAKLGVIDPLLSLLEAGAMLTGWLALQRRNRRAGLWLACYACMGLGTLAKGPVAIVIPALVLTIYAIIERKKVKLGGWSHAAGLALLAAIICAWLLPAITSGGDKYAQTILWKQNAGRVGADFGHRNPFHFYLSGSPGFFFPWIFITPLAVIAAFLNSRKSSNGILALLITWLIAPVLFFSLLASKRVHYVIPVIPPLALLCAWYFTTQIESKSRLLKVERWLMTAALVIAASSAFLGIGAVTMIRFDLLSRLTDSAEATAVTQYFAGPHAVLAVILLLLPAAAAVSGLRTSSELRQKKAVLLVCAILTFSPVIDFTVLPLINRHKSARTFAEHVAKTAGSGEYVRMYRGNFAGLYNLYTGFPVMKVLWTPEDLQRALASFDGFIIADSKDLAETLPDYENGVDVVLSEKIGHRTMLLVKSRAVSTTH